MFGISEFSAIINPPQVGILAVGGGRPELGMVITFLMERNSKTYTLPKDLSSPNVLLSLIDGEGEPKTMMTATLSYDRRAVDEVQVSSFLEAVQRNLENPNMMIVGGLPSSDDAQERQSLGI